MNRKTFYRFDFIGYLHTCKRYAFLAILQSNIKFSRAVRRIELYPARIGGQLSNRLKIGLKVALDESKEMVTVMVEFIIGIIFTMPLVSVELSSGFSSAILSFHYFLMYFFASSLTDQNNHKGGFRRYCVRCFMSPTTKVLFYKI